MNVWKSIMSTIFNLTIFFQHQADDCFLITFFKNGILPYLWIAIAKLKQVKILQGVTILSRCGIYNIGKLTMWKQYTLIYISHFASFH
jgi:hypothetical protein